MMRSGERELTLDLLSARAQRYGMRQQLLRSMRRGREFARRVAHLAMRSWTAALIKPHLKPTDEIRNKQTNRVVRTGVLAA